MTAIATGWAVRFPSGLTYAFCGPLGVPATEDDVWEQTLGARAVPDAKACGARAFRCEVREIGETPAEMPHAASPCEATAAAPTSPPPHQGPPDPHAAQEAKEAPQT